MQLTVLSDIHFASDAEKARRGHESRAIPNPLLRHAAAAYRHFVWLRDPFAHNHLLDDFFAAANTPDLVVGNGDFSCDTAFIGLSDPAAFQSAQLCLARLRTHFGHRFQPVVGDHELGKFSLFGQRGGFRLASWQRLAELGLEPFWRRDLGQFVLLGMTSSLLAFPTYEPEALEPERPAWHSLRQQHLAEIRAAFDSLPPGRPILLFLHDPTALPYLATEPAVQAHLNQVAATIIGHLHSNLVLRASRWLAGIPRITFLGNAARRLTTALQKARAWQPFHVHLCPSLAGVELLKDGGFLELDLGPHGDGPLAIRTRRLPRHPAPR